MYKIYKITCLQNNKCVTNIEDPCLEHKKKLKINLNWLWHSVSNYAFKARYPATPFLLALDYSVVHKIVAIIPAEFDFNMFIKFHTYILTYTKNP